MNKQVNKKNVALVQPYWSHDELLPHLYELLICKYHVKVFLPKNLDETRGNIFEDLGHDVDIHWFNPDKRGLQKTRELINRSEFEKVFLVTFSNYLRRLEKQVVRIVHNVDEEIGRIKEDIEQFKLSIRYLGLSNFVSQRLQSKVECHCEIDTFYPFNFFDLRRQENTLTDSIRLTVLGRVSSTKSYLPLLDYIKGNANHFRSSNITLNVVGSSGNILDECKDLVENNNIHDIVRFFPCDSKILSNNEIFKLLTCNTDYLLPLVSNRYYGVKKISATYSWAIALNIPVIHEYPVNDLYRDIGHCYTNTNFGEIFESSDLNNKYKYDAFCQKLESLKSQCIESNQKLFEGL